MPLQLLSITSFMNGESSTSRMNLETDPLGYLLRNRAALAILQHLGDGTGRTPRALRHSLGFHPQTLKEAVDHLNSLGLVSLVVPAGTRFRRAGRGVALTIEIHVTRSGQAVLTLVDEVGSDIRSRVRRHEKVLPSATVHRWLSD